MSTTQNLSNDAILGLDVDLPIIDSYDYSGAADNVSLQDLQQDQTLLVKPQRKTDKLTPEVLTSKNGIPKIVKRVNAFKFDKKLKSKHNYDLNYRNVRYSNRAKFGEDHHFQNLTKILQMYQGWGHELRSHLKFDRFIQTIFKGMEDTYMKEWLKNQTREEMRSKMEKETLREQRKIAKANALAGKNVSGLRTTLSQEDFNMDEQYEAYQNEQANNNEHGDHEEEWAELFGGDNNGNEERNATASVNEEEEELNVSEIREKSHFSNYLRTSSQPARYTLSQTSSDINIENEEDQDEFNEIDGLQSILEDDDDEKLKENSQSTNFSQYIAIESQKDETGHQQPEINGLMMSSHTNNSQQKGSKNVGVSVNVSAEAGAKAEKNQNRTSDIEPNNIQLDITINKDTSDDDDEFSDDEDTEAYLLNL